MYLYPIYAHTYICIYVHTYNEYMQNYKQVVRQVGK